MTPTQFSDEEIADTLAKFPDDPDDTAEPRELTVDEILNAATGRN